MNYLWEVMIRAREQGIEEKDIKFRIAERFSPYMEVSCSYMNEEILDRRPEIQVNPYYRFYNIFKDLYHPEMREYQSLRQSLTNLILHQLAENDALSGMTREEYYKKLLFDDISHNVFGREALSAIRLFDREEREILLSGLLRQYQTRSSLDIFRDMMDELIPNNIVYQNNERPCEIMIYVGQKEEKTIAAKMDFLTQMFLELPYVTEVYYEYHFGIIGIDETMQIGEIAIC